MNESSKNRKRREDEGFFTKYLQGHGIDIGCGDDSVTTDCDQWDMEQGDAQLMKGVADGTYDWVYSSHLLEHMRDPVQALLNWWRILKPGGYLVVALPDEDLYEQGLWPSVWNPDHKYTWTIDKSSSWSPCSRNLVGVLRTLPSHKIIYIRTLDDGYDHSILLTDKIVDQTQEGANASIEAVVQKLDRQAELRSALRFLILCPRCNKLGLVVRGLTKDNKFNVQCRECGFTGDFSLRPEDDA